jgi:hypothetical protein
MSAGPAIEAVASSLLRHSALATTVVVCKTVGSAYVGSNPTPATARKACFAYPHASERRRRETAARSQLACRRLGHQLLFRANAGRASESSPSMSREEPASAGRPWGDHWHRYASGHHRPPRATRQSRRPSAAGHLNTRPRKTTRGHAGRSESSNKTRSPSMWGSHRDRAPQQAHAGSDGGNRPADTAAWPRLCDVPR